MALTIHKITKEERHVTLRAELAEPTDSDLLHELMLGLVTTHAVSGKLTLLPGPVTSATESFKYPLATPFDLTYDAHLRNLSLVLASVQELPRWSRFK
jgi:hypothetical protein